MAIEQGMHLGQPGVELVEDGLRKLSELLGANWRQQPGPGSQIRHQLTIKPERLEEACRFGYVAPVEDCNAGEVGSLIITSLNRGLQVGSQG